MKWSTLHVHRPLQTPCWGVHNGACGYACLIIAAIACHTAISICHKKMSNLVKFGLELKMN